jgi:hypothetical protein
LNFLLPLFHFFFCSYYYSSSYRGYLERTNIWEKSAVHFGAVFSSVFSYRGQIVLTTQERERQHYRIIYTWRIVCNLIFLIYLICRTSAPGRSGLVVVVVVFFFIFIVYH